MENLKTRIEIAKVNDKEDNSITIEIPLQNKNKLESILKILAPNDEERFNVINCQFKVDGGYYGIQHISEQEYFNSPLSMEDLFERIELLEKDLQELQNISLESLILLVKDSDIFLAEYFAYDDYIFEELVKMYVTYDIDFFIEIEDFLTYEAKSLILQDYVDNEVFLDILKQKGRKSILELLLNETNWTFKDVIKKCNKEYL